MPMAVKLDHWKGFEDFVWMEMLAGGPSANIVVMAEVANLLKLSKAELRWLCACYCAIYNAPAATAMFYCYPRNVVLRSSSVELIDALDKNKPGLPVHSNRLRTNGSTKRMAASMKALAKWARVYEPVKTYDELWSQLNAISSVGRYFAIKLAGIMHRVGLTDVQQYDIRARGAKNGRQSLAYLYPEAAEWLGNYKDNSKGTLDQVDGFANEVFKRLTSQERFKNITWFELEAMLCEYNQAVKGHRYPGKTSDADLTQLNKVIAHFGPSEEFVRVVYKARGKTHPKYALGEEHGWDGKRKEMLATYRDLGYMWSDAIYLYNRTQDLNDPQVVNQELLALALTYPTGGSNGSN